MSKNKLVESFNQYLTNPEENSRVFSKALSASNREERVEALHQLLTYKDDGSIDHTSISAEVGVAIRDILKQDPNILELKKSVAPSIGRRRRGAGATYEVYIFADEVANCKHPSAKDHITEHLRANTKDSVSILNRNNFLSNMLQVQVINHDHKSVVHFITTCNHYNDPRGQELLDEMANNLYEDVVKYSNIITGALTEGMEISEKQLEKLSISTGKLTDMIKTHIDNQSTESPSKLSDKMFNQTLTLLTNKEFSSNRLSSKFLQRAINNGKTKLVCDMAMRGFKLKAYNQYNKGKTQDLATGLLDNKSIFSGQELTENDRKRIVLLASSGMKKEELAEFLKNNKGISPLKLAIDTKQFDIAAKMIADGASLKPSELSLGLRMKNAIGMIDMKLETVKAIESNEQAKSGGFVEKLKQQRAGTKGPEIQ